MKTIADYLAPIAQSQNIEGFDSLGQRPVVGAYWGCGNSGNLNGCCGGPIIAYFNPDGQWPTVLVLDDSLGKQWEREHKNPDGTWIGGITRPRPFPRLVLKQTG